MLAFTLICIYLTRKYHPLDFFTHSLKMVQHIGRMNMQVRHRTFAAVKYICST